MWGESGILPVIQSNHSRITLSFKADNEATTGRGFWKINSNLLHDQNYVNDLKTVISQTVGRRCSQTDHATSLQRRHNGRSGVSSHQPRDCILNRLFGRRWKKTPTPHVTGLCTGNSPVTGKFPAQKASNAENLSIRWRHHVVGTGKTGSTVIYYTAQQ